MPKVKFTALVSDMKGKANGSVFASNNGGTYFRTNKTGGGRKSNAWNAQKAGFADLSSMYRALTVEQQQAWKDARSLYPTTNAFGEPRIPTAFELFMRLNGKLQAAGLDILSVPNTPRDFPAYAPVRIAIPDSYLFHPNKLIKPQTKSGQRIMFYKNGFFNDFDPNGYNSVSCRFIPSTSQDNWVVPNKTYGLFRIFNQNDIIAAAALHIDAEGTMYISFGFRVHDDNEGQLVFINRYYVPKALVAEQLHFSAQFNSQEPNTLEVFVNGTKVEQFQTGVLDYLNVNTVDLLTAELSAAPEWAPIALGTFLAGVVLTDLKPKLRGPFSVSDFRVYEKVSLTETCSNNNPCDEGYQCYAGQCSVPGKAFYPAGSQAGCSDDAECPEGCMCIDNECQEVNNPAGVMVPVWAQKLYRGHLLGIESVAFGLEDFYFRNGFARVANAVKVTNNEEYMHMAYEQNPDCGDDCVGNDFECQDGVCVYVGDRNIMFRDNVLTAGPLAALQAISIDGEGYFMQIYYSGLVSGGRDGNQIPYKLLGTFPINENSVNISNMLLRATGNFSPECNFFFKAAILDGTTGVEYSTEATIAQPPKKNVRRFKAGTTLEGKVN